MSTFKSFKVLDFLNLSSAKVQAGSFHAELSCYSLPFGALGFVSHILTYYTVACLYRGRSPLSPLRAVTHSRFDLIIGILGLVVSSTMAILTLARCRKTWELLTIAIWKLSVSIVNGGTGITVAYAGLEERIKREVEEGLRLPYSGRSYVSRFPLKGNRSYLWLILYVPAMIVGMTGLLTLVHRGWNDPHVKWLTVGFAIVGGIALALGFFVGADEDVTMKPAAYGLMFFFSAFTFFAALYADWALGLIANNLVGLPSSDNSKFYWTYWMAKRLTMFSF
ncbi:hypothetical protein BDN72DRAFT_814932 [Pluteus cervinus]|uniref:Uncharacterized protein n=1 Tax=Pluteus cervinus TaxID=181527 RepID=A0ACD3B506_9AGAR|nr:hypothetical protein BDN72DRAFT_814932 [Pluteus cervinus]